MQGLDDIWADQADPITEINQCRANDQPDDVPIGQPSGSQPDQHGNRELGAGVSRVAHKPDQRQRLEQQNDPQHRQRKCLGDLVEARAKEQAKKYEE